jgi:hypothetical protein
MKAETIFSDLWIGAFWGPVAASIAVLLLSSMTSKLFSKTKKDKKLLLNMLWRLR